MNSFKNGAGNLDFGANETDEKEDEEMEEKENESSSETTPSKERPDSADSDTEEQSSSQPAQQSSPQPSGSPGTAAGEKYPYFVRRSNVGDERENRLEIYVRNKVAKQEADFRSELAEQLGVGEVPKTDAREFALLDAYHHPERVAERMQEEGFGELD